MGGKLADQAGADEGFAFDHQSVQLRYRKALQDGVIGAHDESASIVAKHSAPAVEDNRAQSEHQEKLAFGRCPACPTPDHGAPRIDSDHQNTVVLQVEQVAVRPEQKRMLARVQPAFVHRLLPAAGEAARYSQGRSQPPRLADVVASKVQGAHARAFATGRGTVCCARRPASTRLQACKARPPRRLHACCAPRHEVQGRMAPPLRTLVLRDRFRTDWAAQRRRMNPAGWFAAQAIASDLRDAGLAARTRAFLHECWQRLDAKVATLVIETSSETTTVRFAETLVFERRESSGEISTWQFGRVATNERQPSAIDLRFRVPLEDWWAPMLVRDVTLPDWLKCEATHIGETSHQAMMPLLNLMRLHWIHRQLTAFARLCYDLRALGAALKREVGVDPEILQLAAALWPSAGNSVNVDARLYRLAARHREVLTEIRAKAPNALKLAGGLLMNDEAAACIDLGAVRQHLAAKGVGRSAWKRLLRGDLRPLWRRMANREEGFTDADWAALRLWLRLHERLPDHTLFAARLWAVFHPTRGDFASLNDRCGEIPDVFLNRLALCARRTGVVRRERLVRTLETLVHWISHTGEAGTFGLERGWQRLLEQARADGRRLVARREAERGTLCVLGVHHHVVDGLEARAIKTRTELAEAAIVLRNCADDLADKPVGRHLCFFGVFDGTGACVGMAAYFCTFGIVITHDVRGMFNRPATPTLKDFAESLRQRLATTPAPKPTVTYRKRKKAHRPSPAS